MSSSDIWAFGLNHVLTLIGFSLTTFIAYAGFKTFDKWKREQIEQRRIDLALDALALAYESKFVFESIRSPLTLSSEWLDMKGIDDPRKFNAAGPYYAILKRIAHHKDFFERVWKMQPRFMAFFGKDTSDLFMKLHQARRNIQVSAEMLMEDAVSGAIGKDQDFTKKLKQDIWSFNKPDQIEPFISAFIEGIEERCYPVIKHRHPEIDTFSNKLGFFYKYYYRSRN